MSKQANIKQTVFRQYFRNDSEYIQTVLNQDFVSESMDEGIKKDPRAIPVILPADKVDDDAFSSFWQNLRSFFRHGKEDASCTKKMLPVLLAPHLTHDLSGEDYPLWVADRIDSDLEKQCAPVRTMLNKFVKSDAYKGIATDIIERNINYLLRIIQRSIEKYSEDSCEQQLSKALDDFIKELKVTGEDKEPFKLEVDLLKEHLPDNGVLLNYSDKTVFYLLDLALRINQWNARQSLENRIHHVSTSLHDLLEIEKVKTGTSDSSEKQKDSFSFTESLLNFEEISKMKPEEGSQFMDSERYDRIENAFNELNKAESLFDKSGFVFLGRKLENDLFKNEQLFGNTLSFTYTAGKGIDKIKSEFDKRINQYENIFRALRIAELELEDKYSDDVHNDYFSHFNWKDFTKDEINSCPSFVMISDDKELLNLEYSNLSKLLASNYPVNIFTIRNEEYGTGSKSEKDIDEQILHGSNNLSSFMFSFKNIFLLQSSPITPGHLLNGLKDGLTSFAPSIIHVLNPSTDLSDRPYLWASACSESRDFPMFSFKGLLGTVWGSRLALNNNPQPGSSWPLHSMQYNDDRNEEKILDLHFTFADHLAMLPYSRRHFKVIPGAFWSDDLIPVAQYLNTNNDERISKIPFIWMIDSKSVLHKVAVDWPVVIACQERLDFWRFLQENSGINNYHVKDAVDKVKVEMKEVFDFEIDLLKKEHEKELLKVRDEEADKVIENLANILLDIDLTNLQVEESQTINDQSKTEDIVDKEEEVEELIEEPASPVQETGMILSQDPFIETALCTTCDECTGINNKMFRYNDEKLAYIADANAGTFRQLVEAAEVCPVGIIHPGTPLNKDEPDLEELIERAKKFN